MTSMVNKPVPPQDGGELPRVVQAEGVVAGAGVGGGGGVGRRVAEGRPAVHPVARVLVHAVGVEDGIGDGDVIGGVLGAAAPGRAARGNRGGGDGAAAGVRGGRAGGGGGGGDAVHACNRKDFCSRSSRARRGSRIEVEDEEIVQEKSAEKKTLDRPFSDFTLGPFSRGHTDQLSEKKTRF